MFVGISFICSSITNGPILVVYSKVSLWYSDLTTLKWVILTWNPLFRSTQRRWPINLGGRIVWLLSRNSSGVVAQNSCIWTCHMGLGSSSHSMVVHSWLRGSQEWVSHKIRSGKCLLPDQQHSWYILIVEHSSYTCLERETYSSFWWRNDKVTLQKEYME